MTGEHIVNVVRAYVRTLARAHVHPQENSNYPLAHAAWMCVKIEEFVAEKDYDKANRWLGFVQGVLACAGVHTITEMRDHNRTHPEQKACRATTIEQLRMELDVAVFPSRDLTVGSDKELIVVTTKLPDKTERKHWLQLREVQDLHS